MCNSTFCAQAQVCSSLGDAALTSDNTKLPLKQFSLKKKSLHQLVSHKIFSDGHLSGGSQFIAF